MNVDLVLDVVRIVLGIALIAASFHGSAARTLIILTGVLSVGMGIVALADPQMLGLLPTGFTAFDVGFHLVVGVLAIVAGAVPARDRARSRSAAFEAKPGRQPRSQRDGR